jgi:hypothetical protein
MKNKFSSAVNLLRRKACEGNFDIIWRRFLENPQVDAQLTRPRLYCRRFARRIGISWIDERPTAASAGKISRKISNPFGPRSLPRVGDARDIATPSAEICDNAGCDRIASNPEYNPDGLDRGLRTNGAEVESAGDVAGPAGRTPQPPKGPDSARPIR